MTKSELQEFGSQLLAYCEKYNIPSYSFLELLEDQKVTPMIRGKAMEYNMKLVFQEVLPTNDWTVGKMNLNAQPGTKDADVSIIHRRTGVTLRIESKSAVRGSISDGIGTLKIKGEPHFKVKCHRSRSNKKELTNDRYRADSFDLVVTNPSNALYQGKTITPNLELIHSLRIREMLYEFYKTKSIPEIIVAADRDWRFCEPLNIAERIEDHYYLPRTPYVKLTDDEHWHIVAEIEPVLLRLVKAKLSVLK